MTYAGWVPDAELTGLLAAGERAAFLGVPGQGLIPLERAEVMAREAGDHGGAARAAWLLGLCRIAVGLYGQALEGLEQACADVSAPDAYRSLAASATADIHRQLGRAGAAREWDLAALDMAEGSPEAHFEAQVGLAADAVALSDPDAALEALDRAEALVAENPVWWRQRVRLEWTRSEVDLLRGDPGAARAAADRALDIAEAWGAPRHVAQSLLLAGVAAAARGRADGAVDLLARAAVLAEGLGARPLIWPSRAFLAALTAADNPVDVDAHLEAARAAVRQIADDLEEDLAEGFLARPDVRALDSVASRMPSAPPVG